MPEISGNLAGWIGAIVGGVVGVLGGLVGTYFSIKNTGGPRERAVMVKVSLIFWAAIIVFLAVLLLLPSPYRHLLWIAYVPLLLWGIITCNKKQAQIRREESGDTT